jgi:hypothetical protein
LRYAVLLPGGSSEATASVTAAFAEMIDGQGILTYSAPDSSLQKLTVMAP